jgi:hypothetical protein
MKSVNPKHWTWEEKIRKSSWDGKNS